MADSGATHQPRRLDGRTRASSDSKPPENLGRSAFDWSMTLLVILLVFGTYLDGWAHNTGRTDASFFTPWHAILYAAVFMTTVFLIAELLRRIAQGRSVRTALPTGYGLSLIGAGLFILAGVADMVWHLWLGVEAVFEALYSPPHLLLGASGIVIAGGPMRAASGPPAAPVPRWSAQLPLLFSLTAILSGLTFLTQDIHWTLALPAVSHRPPAVAFDDRQIAGLAAILLQTGVMMGMILFALRRWTLVPGALTLILGTNAVAMVFQDRIHRFDLAASAVLAAAIADLLLRMLKPGDDLVRLRLFAFGVPAVFYTLYFLTLVLVEGVWWSPALCAGAVILSGFTGVLLSYLVTPPSAAVP